MSQQSTTNGVPWGLMSRTPMQAPRRTTAVRERSKQRARHHPYNGARVLAFLLGSCLAQCAPVAFALSVHEKIGMWIRRIARQCAGRDVRGGTSAKLTAGDVNSGQQTTLP
jgi:hypothetical protein